jgi:aminomethyltransferase
MRRNRVMADESLLETPLASWHRAHGGRMVAFGGWSMPVQYTAILEEHQAVRRRAGLFDISHMGRLSFTGPDALAWLERATTNQVARLQEGQVQYSLMANEQGGVIDDVLLYGMRTGYQMVCNAANRSAVRTQLDRLRPVTPGTFLTDCTRDTAMIAVQGPEALATLQPLCRAPLDPVKYYHSIRAQLLDTVEAVVSRTGYTGEDGFELITSAEDAVPVWEALLDSGRSRGVLACGLGARDTLRLEAAMPLYGHELSESINPYAAGVGWAVKLGKGDFVGRAALRAYKQDPGQLRVGLRLEGKRIARQGHAVLQEGRTVGTVTSGTFAPTLGQSIAMALVESGVSMLGTVLAVDVRGHFEPAQVVQLPFYQRSPAARLVPDRP